MREYGGYIELEHFTGTVLHEEGIALNCGRNALVYICKKRKINKILVPYFICSSITDALDKANVEYEFYHISETFEPIFDFVLNDYEWLYIVNYYGQISNDKIKEWHHKYVNIIVDNAQSYYQMPIRGIDTIYTCRKYFGVSDGAFLHTELELEEKIDFDESYGRMNFLLGRFERGASEFYPEYCANNSMFANEPIKRMSALTMNLLRAIDYECVAKRRMSNFSILLHNFKEVNKLDLNAPYGAFMFPLWIDNGIDLRKKLQLKKIYIPTLWPNVIKMCTPDTLEYQFAVNILPIPVDQRYDDEDMEYLTNAIMSIVY